MQRVRRSSGMTLVMVLAIAALSGGTALAQPSDTAWVFGGYVLDTLFANETDLNDAIGFGVRGGYMFGGKHQMELSIDQLTGESQGPAPIDVDVRKVGVNYVRQFQLRNKEKMIPVTIFGLGLITTDDGVQDESSAFYAAGGGMKYLMTKRLALRFDAKIYRWDGDGKVLPVNSLFSFDIAVGLSFTVGGGT